MWTLFLTDKVVNLRAWQLYLGNSIYTFLVGFIIIIISSLFGAFGGHNRKIDQLLDKVGYLAGGSRSGAYHVMRDNRS